LLAHYNSIGRILEGGEAGVFGGGISISPLPPVHRNLYVHIHKRDSGSARDGYDNHILHCPLSRANAWRL